jgi:transposase
MFGECRIPVQQIPADAVISPYNHSLDRKITITRKVQIRMKSDPALMKERMCLSEHPFGTVKWYHGAQYLLCRGKEKATAELGLSFLAYNMGRAMNMVGTKALIAAM